MRIQLVDSSNRDHLLPLTFTRPVSALRCGILTIAEKYAQRGHVIGNDREGYPQTAPLKDKQGNPYTVLSYRDGPGANIERDHDGHEAKHERLNDPDYQQIALVPMDYETHGGENVALYAIGPQSQLFSGTLEQHWVFHSLKYAM